MKKKYKTALIIGRFQPFHNGHLYLIKKALECADKIIIGIGSANVSNDDNPYSITKRQLMIQTMINSEQIQDRVSEVVFLDDYNNDEKWLKQILDKVTKFDLVIGNNEWTNRILEKAGFSILRMGYYKRYQYEGQKIRELQRRKKGEWIARVPLYLESILNTF